MKCDVVVGAGLRQCVKRFDVVGHVAVRRVDDGGAAIQYVVAAEQQAVFHQHQAHVVGSVAGGVHHLQGMGAANPGCVRNLIGYAVAVRAIQ
jgi:hypothetical protein